MNLKEFLKKRIGHLVVTHQVNHTIDEYFKAKLKELTDNKELPYHYVFAIQDFIKKELIAE